METASGSNKMYELAFHLNPDLGEGEVKLETEGIFKTLAQNHGTIISQNEPRKIHLSYPVKHKHYGFFGTVKFMVPPENVEKIDSQFKLVTSILRCMIIQMPEEKEIRILGEHRYASRRPRTKISDQETAEAPDQKTREVNLEELEREVEKVIEKL